MAIKSHDVQPADPIGHRSRTFPVQSVTANGTVTIASHAPLYRYQIQTVRVFAGTGTTAVSAVDVKIGAATVLASPVVPAAGTEVLATLTTSVPARRGAKGTAFSITVTAGASPVLANMYVEVVFRPYPMNGEAALGV